MNVTPLFYVSILSVIYASALVFRIVKPNRWIGWRMPAGKEDNEEVWFTLNRCFGLTFLVANLLVIAWILFHMLTGTLPVARGESGTTVAWVLYVGGFLVATSRTYRLQKEIERDLAGSNTGADDEEEEEEEDEDE